MPARPPSARAFLASGNAMASVTIIGMDRLDAALKALDRMGNAGAYTAYIGTDLVDPPYPYFLEYGTSRMPAYPAARPAWDEMGDTAVRAAGDYMGQLIAGGQRDPERVMVPALREAARPIENRWKELARYKTGDYRRSIHTEVRPGTEP